MEPHFLLDLEIQDLHTVDHAALAKSILRGIELAPPPFRIALFGPWGSGKSTILKMVQNHMEEISSDDGDPEGFYLKPLWFNAWEYESHPNLLYHLISLLTMHIPDGVRYSRKGARIVRQVAQTTEYIGQRWNKNGAGESSVVSRPPAPSDNGAEGNGNEPDHIHTMKHAFHRLVDYTLVQAPKGRRRKLVIFIDDLDKCLPNTVLTFLEGLKLFLDPGTPLVLIFALDREVLRGAIQQKYNRDRSFETDRYMEKIFEFSYDVPPIAVQQIGPLISELYERSGLRHFTTSNGLAVSEQESMERVLSHPGVSLSARKIKRVFNKFIWFFASRHRLEVVPPMDSSSAQIALPGTNDSPDPFEDDMPPLDHWLTWLLISEYWREYRQMVVAHGEPALGELCNRVTGNPLFPHANQQVRARFESLPDAAGLLEYFRSVFGVGRGAALLHVQNRMRERIREFERIDRILHLNGV